MYAMFEVGWLRERERASDHVQVTASPTASGRRMKWFPIVSGSYSEKMLSTKEGLLVIEEKCGIPALLCFATLLLVVKDGGAEERERER
jgi:hypothetical protein